MSKPKYRILNARIRRLGHAQSRETLGSLSSSATEASRQYHDLVQSIRDGASEQRCGGGIRVIRKQTPE